MKGTAVRSWWRRVLKLADIFFKFIPTMKMDEGQLAQQIDRARSFLRDEKYLHAIQVYLRLIHTQPGSVRPFVELASVYSELEFHDDAVAVLKRAYRRFQEDDEIAFLLGTLHLRMNRFNEALTWFKLIADRRLPQVHFNMGIAYISLDQIARAEEQFRLTLKLDPRFPKIYASLGEVFIRKNAYVEAVRSLKRAVDADPYSSLNHHLLGIAYTKLFDWKHALDEFIFAIEMDPEDPVNWQLCGDILIRLHRLDEAEPYLGKAYELNPQSPETLVALAQLYAEKENTERALTYLEQALQLDRGNPRAREIRWKLRQGRKGTTDQPLQQS